ncbi:MAG TPA: hypothetical protein VFW94_07860 [Candidatus Acidoferrales bacterium]|nr:hypothetical protein [Candidatus Acidoferrales bacterium]
MLYNRAVKGYITRWEQSKAPDTPHRTNYWFDHRAECALIWPSKEQAESDCRFLFNGQIEIPSAFGGTHLCNDFKVEETPQGFAVFCEAPFIPVQPQEKK